MAALRRKLRLKKWRKIDEAIEDSLAGENEFEPAVLYPYPHYSLLSVALELLLWRSL